MKVWECSSVVEYLASMCRAQSLMTSTAKKKERERKGGQRGETQEAEVEGLLEPSI